ncbi:putative F-box protein At1g49610 [Herrania umbratica]|uniref:F-box protein At1g49610 n=1 Tax=Herrania umbratica TaxID=108875 RepID=A0A6J1B5H1_9ROSI|nr:putative F-box protein At1g49610 [Herrania umbratica]
MEDQKGSVCSEQSTGSVSSVLAVIQGQHRRSPHRNNLNFAQTSVKYPRFSPIFEYCSPPVDLISTLPDFLIQEILSFLPIEDAIKTSVLSRRWYPLWTQIPTLSFSHSSFCFKLAKFVEVVNRTLQRFSGHTIKNFSINFKFTESLASYVEEWVLFAISHHVEKLCLVFDGGLVYAPFAESTPFWLPQFLYVNSYLKDLTLRQCVVSPDGYASWPSLKVLSINYSRLNNEAIENILSGSPNLRNLKLHNCERIKRISSRSLEVLVVDGIYDPHEKEDCVTEISCPNLQSLSLLGFMYRRTYRLMHVSSLSKANLGFVMTIDKKDKYDYTKHRYILRELLEKLCHVEELTVGTWCLQVLSIWEIKGISSPLSKRSCLVLDTEICEWDLPGIVSLLQSSPYLKKLVLNLSPCDNSKFEFDQEFFNSYELDGVAFLSSANWIFKSFLQSLEHIEITGFQPSSSGSKLLVELMQFLLNDATELKKVVIYEQSGALYRSWKSSWPDRNMGNFKRNQIMMIISNSIPVLKYSSG